MTDAATEREQFAETGASIPAIMITLGAYSASSDPRAESA